MAGVDRIRLSELFSKSGAIMYLFDLESLQIIDANPAAQRFYGYSREEFLARKITDLSTLSLAEIRENIRKELRYEASFYLVQHCLSSGELRHLEIHATPLLQEDGREAIFSVAHDVTDQIQAEKALRESEQRFRNMADVFPTPLAIMAPGGENLYLNRQFTKVFGYTHEELASPEAWFELSYPDPELRRRYLAEFREWLERGRPPVRWDRMATIKDGSVRRIVLQATPLTGGQVLVVAEDMSGKERAEQELLEAERVKVALETAGGTCHELNQPLQVILGQLDLLLVKADPQSTAGRKLAQIMIEVERMAGIVKKLSKLTTYRAGDYAGVSKILRVDESAEEE